MKKIVYIFLGVFVFFGLIDQSHAESIKFKSGQILETKVASTLGDFINLDMGGGVAKYNFDQIESIDGVPVESWREQFGADDSVSGAENAFKKELARLLVLSRKSGVTEEERSKGLTGLKRFTANYVDNVFVKDALFSEQMFRFQIAINSEPINKEAALQAIAEMERVSDRFQGASLELITCKMIEAEFPEGAPDVPFKYAPAYMRGYLSFLLGDSKMTIQNLSEIARKLVPKRPGEVTFLQNVFEVLILAYMDSDNREDGFWAVEAAVNKFPNTPLAEKYKNLVSPVPDAFFGKPIRRK